MKIGRINKNYEEERLYSTGSDELDNLLERAFCEGYEYAQREFGKKKKEEDGYTPEEKKRITKSGRTGAAIGAGVVGGTRLLRGRGPLGIAIGAGLGAAGGSYVGRKIGKKHIKEDREYSK